MMHIDELTQLLEQESAAQPSATVTVEDVERAVHNRRRRVSVVAAAVALTLLGAGMLSERSTGPSRHDLEQIVTATGAATSARVYRYTVVKTREDGGDWSTLSPSGADGFIDLLNRRSQYVSRRVGAQSLEGRTSMSLDDEHWTEINEPERIRLGLSAHWIRSVSKGRLDDFGPSVFPDPLSWLEANGRQPQPRGRARVRGVPTTRYAVPIDIRGFDLSVEIWVDGDGRLRRYQLTQRTDNWAPELGGPRPGSKHIENTIITTSELFDFGVETPEITPPPLSDTISPEELNAVMQRANDATNAELARLAEAQHQD